MEVKIPKEIRDYQESVFFGLSFRQFFCSVMAVGTAVGLYFWLNPLLGTEMTGWMCIFGAAPFAACGFFRYRGMTAEQFAWAFSKVPPSITRLTVSKRLVSLTPSAMDSSFWKSGYPIVRLMRNRSDWASGRSWVPALPG